MAQVPATQRSQGSRLAPRRENTPERMRRDFNSLFDRLWNGWLVPFDQDLEPVRLWDFDVTENDKEIVVRAEIPGFEPNELEEGAGPKRINVQGQQGEGGQQQISSGRGGNQGQQSQAASQGQQTGSQAATERAKK